jgi:RimJ/RimL family protein N-acetyltransferase
MEPLTHDHADALFAGLSDSRLYAFIDDSPPQTIEQLRQRYQRLERRSSSDGSETWLNWAIYSQADARYAGYAQATLYDQKMASLGYVIFFDEWGKGFGTEAMRGVIDYLTAVYRVQHFDATVDSRNTRSRRILEKLGFHETSSATTTSGLIDVRFERPA